jgi:hypothetical protein
VFLMFYSESMHQSATLSYTKDHARVLTSETTLDGQLAMQPLPGSEKHKLRAPARARSARTCFDKECDAEQAEYVEED